MDSKDATEVSVAQQTGTLTRKDSLWRFAKKVARETAKSAIEEVAKIPNTLTTAVVRWVVTRPPHGRQTGAHPEWPGYTGVGTTLDFDLQTHAYNSRCLVESTVPSFYPTEGDRNLTPTQIAARAQIISLCKAAKIRKKAVETADMEQYMRLFDQFFFFGALVNKIRPRVVLKFWTHFHNLDEIRPFNGPSLPWGFTRDRYVRGYGPIAEIHIAGELFFGGPVPLWFFLETLLHEMVHAYINLYLCRCTGCYANMLDTYGVTGHGRTFLMLIDTIDQTVKTWNAGLAGVMTGKIVAGQPYDEIKLLYEKEKKIVQGCNAAHTRKSSSQPDETRSPQAPADAARGKKRRKLARAPAPWNMLKPLEETEPGAQVYMTGAQTGATKVEQSKLDQTCDTVQALLAKKKAGAKFSFRWSIS